MTRSLHFLALAFLVSPCMVPTAASAQPKADETLDEVLETFCQELVELTPGAGGFPASTPFGPPENQRQVELTSSFRIGKYEVPQNLYLEVMGRNPSRWGGPRNAVEMVDGSEATAFCEKLTRMLREKKLIGGDEIVRLPTEVEWEYACRAGSADAYCFGAEEDRLGDYCWYDGNAAGNDPPVGAKRPNDWGIYDMHGYVWEWTSPSERDSAGAEPKRRVIRGGAWTSPAAECASHARRVIDATSRGPDIGFRCVVVGAPPEADGP